VEGNQAADGKPGGVADARVAKPMTRPIAGAAHPAVAGPPAGATAATAVSGGALESDAPFVDSRPVSGLCTRYCRGYFPRSRTLALVGKALYAENGYVVRLELRRSSLGTDPV